MVSAHAIASTTAASGDVPRRPSAAPWAVWPDMVKVVAETLMKAEVETLCGANYAHRGEQRINSRNGLRHRRWSTRYGTVALAIPKLRRGSYFPVWLFNAPGEQTLAAFVSDCWAGGVEENNVRDLIRALHIQGVEGGEVTGLVTDFREILTAFRSKAPKWAL